MLRITGAVKYIAEMTAAARGAGVLAAAEAALTASTEVLAGALSLVGGRLAIIGAIIASVTGAVGFGVKAFSDANDVVLRAAIVLRNMGSSFPIEKLQEFASELQRLTGIDDEAIIAAGALLARFRVAGDLIPEALKAITDAAASTNQSVEEIAQLFGRGLLPNGARALRQLGIQFTATGDRVKDTKRLIELFNQINIGTASARGASPFGVFQRLLRSVGELFEAIGRIAGPGIVFTANQFIATIDFMTKKLTDLADILARYGLAFPATPKTPGGIVPGSAAALGLDDALSENTNAVKANTKAQEGIIRQAFGGPGTIGKAAGNIRALRSALGNASF